jgi:hypothetical protein
MPAEDSKLYTFLSPEQIEQVAAMVEKIKEENQ